MDFVISELVEVKAPGIRLGHRGRVVNRLARNRLLYAVQFADNWIGYFEKWELEKVPPEDTATDWEGERTSEDIACPEK